MINRQITYERDIQKSYMKIPSPQEECYDEKILFRRTLEGTVPMEKCYMNGTAQYWYNISGKQALDAYCRVNKLSCNFLETIILRICQQLEVLEWNLVDSNCLMVDPELIFVSNKGEEISFVLYPQNRGDFFEEFQQLLEYMLPKLNHTDKESIRGLYELYEMILTKEYSILDLKQAILEKRVKERKLEETSQALSQESVVYEVAKRKEETILQEKNSFFEKIDGLFERVKGILERSPAELMWRKRDDTDEIPEVVYPGEEIKNEETEIHPTVCLSSLPEGARGILVYEGLENYSDFELEKKMCVIGKSHRVRFHIGRETISNFHAKIDFVNDAYYIEDMNSTNGTYVNDEILNYKERKQLNPGDMLRFADVKYRFL